MAEFALLPLFAVPLLVEYAHHGLRIHAERDFLHLNRLEEFGNLALRSFGGNLLFIPGFLFGCCFFLLGRFGLGGLGFVKGDCFLRLGSFFLYNLFSPAPRVSYCAI